MTERLTSAKVAALLDMKPGTWRMRVHRGQAPKPDGHHDRRTPYWFRSTIDTYTQQKAQS